MFFIGKKRTLLCSGDCLILDTETSSLSMQRDKEAIQPNVNTRDENSVHIPSSGWSDGAFLRFCTLIAWAGGYECEKVEDPEPGVQCVKVTGERRSSLRPGDTIRFYDDGTVSVYRCSAPVPLGFESHSPISISTLADPHVLAKLMMNASAHSYPEMKRSENFLRMQIAAQD